MSKLVEVHREGRHANRNGEIVLDSLIPILTDAGLKCNLAIARKDYRLAYKHALVYAHFKTVLRGN